MKLKEGKREGGDVQKVSGLGGMAYDTFQAGVMQGGKREGSGGGEFGQEVRVTQFSRGGVSTTFDGGTRGSGDRWSRKKTPKQEGVTSSPGLGGDRALTGRKKSMYSAQ